MAFLLTPVLSVVALLGAGATVVAAWIVTDAFIYLRCFGPSLERDLGFRDDTAILPDSGMRGYVSAVAVSSVSEEGPFGRAGVRSGDVLPDESHISLFKKLHCHRGKIVELAIVDGGDGPPFHERPRRAIRIPVPPRWS
jgi:hypothetical protein